MITIIFIAITILSMALCFKIDESSRHASTELKKDEEDDIFKESNPY